VRLKKEHENLMNIRQPWKNGIMGFNSQSVEIKKENRALIGMQYLGELF
jgi:hypothetical protein